jgi:GEVED domain-containing protein/matrixin
MSCNASFRRAVVAVLAVAVSAAGPSFAFNIIGSNANPAAGALLRPTTLPATGIFRHWDLREFDNCEIPYAINLAGTADIVGIGEFTAIQNAATSWTAVTPALVSLVRRPNTATAAQAQDGENILWWDGTNASGLIGGAGSGILGVTSIYTQVATGRIQESDIVFNDRDFQWNTTGDDFTSVRTGNTSTWNVNNGQTIILSVDAGANQTITLAGVTNGAATPAQIAATINAQIVGGLAFPVGPIAGPVDRVQIVSNLHDGTGTINVTGGTANGQLAFPAGATVTDAADVQTIALHEMGHMLGIHHSSQASPEPNLTYFNAVMYWAAPDNGTKRVLTTDDTNALNFLYTPDLGDAPDVAQKYQTLVHTGGANRTLNGVDLHAVGIGPEHLFGYFGEDTLKLEWLGDVEDGSDLECEARVVNADASDDGVLLPFPMIRTVPNVVTVTISYKNAARYNSAIPGRRLMFNGYFDWNNDQLFDNSDLEIYWTGDPTAGTFSNSANWVSAFYGTAGKIILTFAVTPPANAPSVYARFRLDLGEDEGRVSNTNADLGPAVGAAQFGEVEDYYVATTNPPPTAVLVGRFDGVPAGEGVDLSWSTPQGGVSEKVNLYRTDRTGVEELLAAVDAGADGGRYHDASVVLGETYTYRLGLFDQGGEVAGPSIRVIVPAAELSLAGMSPNPTDRNGTVTFSLPTAGHAVVALYGVDGRRMRVLADREFSVGTQRLGFDGQDDNGNRLAPGVYFVKLAFGREARVSRTLILR